jgi:hypothetical protein
MFSAMLAAVAMWSSAAAGARAAGAAGAAADDPRAIIEQAQRRTEAK